MHLTESERRFLEDEATKLGRALEGHRAKLMEWPVGDDADQARRLEKIRVSLMEATHVLVAYLWGVRNATVPRPEDKK